MIISLRFSELDAELVKKSAMERGSSVSSFIRDSTMERIEKEFREMLKKEEVVRREEKD